MLCCCRCSREASKPKKAKRSRKARDEEEEDEDSEDEEAKDDEPADDQVQAPEYARKSGKHKVRGVAGAWARPLGPALK